MRRTAALLTAVFMGASVIFTGCGASQVVDNVATELKSEGREYGQAYELKQNETMSTAFFDLKINSVEEFDELEGYEPNDSNNTFLVVNVTVTNTFDSEIPMSYEDFPISWEALGEERVYPDYEFTDTLPETYNILKGGEKTGNLIFNVPKDITDFTLEYYDLWDDDFEGNTYSMSFSAK